MTYSAPHLVFVGAAHGLVLGSGIGGRPFKDNQLCPSVPLSRDIAVC